MAGAWTDEVANEEAIEEDTLRSNNHKPCEAARLGKAEERKQMHALIVGFLEQSFDPA